MQVKDNSLPKTALSLVCFLIALWERVLPIFWAELCKKKHPLQCCQKEKHLQRKGNKKDSKHLFADEKLRFEQN